VYPRDAQQPIGEDQLLAGPLEPTNEAYAIAKIAGIKLCESYRTQYGDNFIAAMPTNLYGPNETSSSGTAIWSPCSCDDSTRPRSPERRL
jgi:nucleoside-diphosphate-sugar epimerase